MMTFIDLFAGVGGFRRGLELAGHKCVGFCEFDKFAVASYTSMHLITDEQRKYLATLDLKKRQKEILKDEYRNGEWYSSDIRSVRADDVPRADCWCFGAPCQSFSIAGKRKGLEGQSGLIREVFRIIRETMEENRPEWLVYENVKGMLSSNRGYDFLAILLEMDELGYDCEWQIFNSKYHDVPQNRERVYTLGHLRRYGERKVFPLRGADEENNICKVEQIAQQNSTHRKNPNQYRVYDSKGLSPCLNKMDGGEREPHIPIFGIDYNSNGKERQTANALTTRNNENGVGNVNQDGTAVCIPVLTPERTEKRQNGRRFKDNGEEAFTLTAQDRHGVAIGGIYTQVSEDFQRGVLAKTARANKASAHDNGVMLEVRNKKADIPVVWYEKYNCYIAIRKLTPKECFRLQGWTDDYFEKAQFVNSDSQLYKQAGNGVTVTVVEDIGKRLKEV
jgi:DNA (cytosine-5)-methyltransferase 1